MRTRTNLAQFSVLRAFDWQPALRGRIAKWLKGLAEREGFEPPLPIRVNLISSQAPSTGLGHLSATVLH